ncbi:alpha amylase, catalytic region [Desulforamulus reducens MI-1]|uniref:Alpha amylase, catalytic region n=1 Tax=Desulforamulus reducens (strain ATCC BAA-1160 / DSM 100696 / MI-1) TaxID=349161 RepID=A4J4I5_DESRM|nr:glycoside hydrolase family 13 protein [Desulforamulus reducens]ABO49988.1 alpha amylase, catalytic region [Desulforamulus reducens MI-1]
MNVWIYHNSHEVYYRNPFGAVSCDERVILSLTIEIEEEAHSIFLRLWKHGREEEKIPMRLREGHGNKKTYQVEINVPSVQGLLWYYFIIGIKDKTYYYGNNYDQLGGIGEIYEHEPPSYQITVYKRNLVTPNWFKDAVMYQIFVDRFCNGYEAGQVLNPKEHCIIYPHWDATPQYGKCPETGKTVCYDFFGGNLLGVIKKLPYLKELGIRVIYFNPIFEAASNHKYDTGDYKKIDPMFGDHGVFQELCKKAQEMGISIILDGVFSHTGSNSRYFNRDGQYPSLGAYQSKDSPYYSWYRFTHFPNEYDCWWGIDTLPNVNELDPSYQEYIITGEDSVIKHWMRMGAKGWRLDVVDELPPEFIKKIRSVMKHLDPESILIGEVWEDATNKVSYGQMREYLLGEELDSVMNYPFRNIWLEYLLGKRDARSTHLRLMNLFENYPLHHFYSTMNLISSHDVSRALTVLSDAPPEDMLSREEQAKVQLSEIQLERGLARLKLLSLLQMTFPGVPCIYYGDEVGMHGYRDPLNRGTYPWGKENSDLLAWYKKLIALRNEYEVLRTGLWRPIYMQGQIYGYLRVIKQGKDVFNRPAKNHVALVLVNPGRESAVEVSIPLKNWCNGTMMDLLQVDKTYKIENGLLHVKLEPLQGTLLIDR